MTHIKENNLPASYTSAMRFARLFLLLLICVALPFNNVAAATMIHCAQAESAAEHEIHSGAHADHASRAAAHDDGRHNDADHGDAPCSDCSYCQACVSAIASSPATSLRAPAPANDHLLLTVVILPSVKDQPFRPPMLFLA